MHKKDFYVCTPEYYDKAIRMICRKVGNRLLEKELYFERLIRVYQSVLLMQPAKRAVGLHLLDLVVPHL